MAGASVGVDGVRRRFAGCHQHVAAAAGIVPLCSIASWAVMFAIRPFVINAGHSAWSGAPSGLFSPPYSRDMVAGALGATSGRRRPVESACVVAADITNVSPVSKATTQGHWLRQDETRAGRYYRHWSYASDLNFDRRHLHEPNCVIGTAPLQLSSD